MSSEFPLDKHNRDANSCVPFIFLLLENLSIFETVRLHDLRYQIR